MKTFKQAIQEGFNFRPDNENTDTADVLSFEWSLPGYWNFTFGEHNEYELCFEPLLFDNQYYVALYKNKDLLTEKVVIKPGYVKEEENYE